MQVEDWNLFGASQGRRVDALFDSVAGSRRQGRGAGGRRARGAGGRHRASTGAGRASRSCSNRAGDADRGRERHRSPTSVCWATSSCELDPGPAGAPPLADGAALPGSTPESRSTRRWRRSTPSAARSRSHRLDRATAAAASASWSTEHPGDRRRAARADRRQSCRASAARCATSNSSAPRWPTSCRGSTAQIERVLAQVDTVVGENRGNLQGIDGEPARRSPTASRSRWTT